MMEKIVIENTEYKVHHFYCDECNKYLGKSEEYEDGYYEKIGEFKHNIQLSNGWNILEKCLCPKCKNKLINKIEGIAKELGYKKREEW